MNERTSTAFIATAVIPEYSGRQLKASYVCADTVAFIINPGDP